MKKLFFILICFSAAFIMSCGGSEGGSGKACESTLDCNVGEVCSNGTCRSKNSANDGSGEDGELPDGGNGHGSGGNDGETTDDSDSTGNNDDLAGNCKPGETKECSYQGPEETKDVGPCKAGVSTCKEDGNWGKCEGAVEPVLENNEELCTNGIDDDCDGTVDNGINNACSYWHDDEVSDADADTTSDPGIIDVGYTGDYSDAYQIPSDALETVCTDECIPEKAECLPNNIVEGEVDSALCNGLDDDCDGEVDEGCPCSPGQTQACFLGPKNYRNKGTCADGTQTCKVTMRGTRSVGRWGECVGGISPTQDVCDNADNNCNGCDDDKLCCQPPIDCAYNLTADGDFLPFKYKIIDGKQIYDAGHKFNDADTATWTWTLTKGPCDEVLGKVNSYVKGGKTLAEVGDVDTDNGTQNTVVSGVGLSQFKVKFRLSGNYKLHLKVDRGNGEIYECEWVIRVVSAGLRIELCWDTNNTVDVDLHMGKNGKTSDWASSSACYFSTKNPDWGYLKTDNYNKDGVWTQNMNNPRLDIDNVHAGAIPENINIDNPEPNDVFRVGARYYPFTSPDNKVTHPVINVYCGGTLKATYGVDPQVNNFKNKDDFWKVVEVKWVGDYSSDACELTPKWDDSTGYVVNKQAVPGYSSW